MKTNFSSHSEIAGLSLNSNWHKHSAITNSDLYQLDDETQVGEDEVFMVSRFETRNLIRIEFSLKLFSHRRLTYRLRHPSRNRVPKEPAVTVS